MTAGMLSTLPNGPGRDDPHRRPCHGPAARNAAYAARLDPDHVFRVPSATAAPRPSRPPDPPEYEARGLLNLVAFAARCLAASDSRSDERERWRTEIDRANTRLEELHAAGLPRDFLTRDRRSDRIRSAACVSPGQ